MRRLSESRQITRLIVVTLIIGVAGLAALEYFPELWKQHTVRIDDFQATFYLNGTLIEEYTYTVKQRGYRTYSRGWKLPLSTGTLDRPSVQLIEVYNPPGTLS